MTDHFAALNESRRPWLDPGVLKEKFHTLSSAVHPDRVHGAAESVRHEAGTHYTALNAAYQCLREPKERLQHLLQLERGGKLGDLNAIPENVVQLFGEVGALLRQTEPLLAEKAHATSALVRVGVLERAMPHLEKISALQAGIAAQRTTLLDELHALDQDWSGRLLDPANREAALAAAERLYHLFGFYDRWAGQLQERVIQLTM